MTTSLALSDFDFALPAVGLIGAWVLLGLCTMLLVTGIAKINPTLYEPPSSTGRRAGTNSSTSPFPACARKSGSALP